jgi:hypothetical protein
MHDTNQVKWPAAGAPAVRRRRRADAVRLTGDGREPHRLVKCISVLLYDTKNEVPRQLRLAKRSGIVRSFD